MNKIAGDFQDIYKENVFVDAISGDYIPAGEAVEFTGWHSFGQGESFDQVNVDGGELIDHEPAVLEERQLGILRVLKSQKRQSIDMQVIGSHGSSASTRTAVQSLPVLDVSPDWSVPQGVSLQYLTEVIETFSGAEQRISLRDKPRVTADFQISLFDEQRYLFDNKFMSKTGKVLLPMWTFQCHCDTSTHAINLKSTNRFMQAARFLLLVAGDQMEVVSIEARQGLAWSLGFLALPHSQIDVLAVPLFPASFKNDSSSVIVNDFYETSAFNFLLDPLHIELERSEEHDFPVMYDRMEIDEDGDLIEGNEKPILIFRPDRTQDITVNYARLSSSFDPGTGVSHDVDRTAGAIRVFNFDFTFFSEQERQRFDDFAHICRGAQREFYCESPAYGFEIISANEKELVVKNAGADIISSTAARAVAIHVYNGDKLYRKIDSIVNNQNATQTLILAEPVPDFEAKDVYFASPLFLSRFESDDFNYSFQTTDISTITKTIKQLIYGESLRY